MNECEVCDFKNAKRYGRADWRCPNCGKQLILEMVLMADAGIDYTKITPTNHCLNTSTNKINN